MSDRHTAGFKKTTTLGDARETVRSAIAPISRTRRAAIDAAVGRPLAETVTASRDLPHYTRVAMDGYAVRAADTVGASERAPRRLGNGSAPVEQTRAVPVHTGSALPEGADAVVPIEHVDERADGLDVSRPVAVGENVAPAGEDVAAGETLFEPGHRLRPSDLGLLKAVGVDRVETVARPTLSIVSTGEELVEARPDPGEAVETNGLTVATLVERWGGTIIDHETVSDDPGEIGAAIDDAADRDVIVTTGGTSVGRRDEVPEVIADRGRVLVHGVALKPGHPVGFGVVDETPVLMLPGYPVSCIVNAVQLLRPALARLGRLSMDPHPTTAARLQRKIASEPGVRAFARVRLEEGEDGPVAVPTRTSGAGVLSSVTEADGWVVVPESIEGVPADETVTVEHWEAGP